MKSFISISLQTERLTLRPVKESDAEDLYAIFSDPTVMRYGSSTPWTSIDQALKKISLDREALKKSESLILGVIRNDDNKLIGTCSLFDINWQCRRAEIGYILSSKVWGQGYMNEALHTLLDFGFDELNFHRVEADIDPNNKASERILQKLGFTEEGLLRERWIVDGEITDTGFYGLLQREWRSKI
ncbi:MAG: GNAT family N-acetyltransferase [Candidatus Marinimicrobia bacterium]|nr:GNAT family N-acetyltransferase [Candidatus Neomarinimicrobiota bacterium]MCF7850283.1 GNAT family N-acetyltransferase [Candidatus Neomarinimicrobiota bacterium]MCF7903820.1 GNAT family N-acetyltransferase [Candidatus Neomarinimicrobiota bacterium]